MILQAAGDTPRCQSDLTGDKVFAAALRLVVEQNTVAGKHSIRLTILSDHPKPILFRYRIRTVRMERRVLILRAFLHLAIQLGGRRLINTAGLIQSGGMYRFQNAKHTKGIHIACIFRRIEGHLHMALCSKVIYLVRLDLQDDAGDAGRVRQIPLMDLQLVQNMIDTGSCRHRRSANDAMYFIPLLQQKLRQIRAVLPGDAGDKCFFHSRSPLYCRPAYRYSVRLQIFRFSRTFLISPASPFSHTSRASSVSTMIMSSSPTVAMSFLPP